MCGYAGLTYLICCAGAGRPDYPTFIGRWWHIDPGYAQQSNPGYLSQPRCRIPTIKEENIQSWKQSMVIGCTVEVYLPSLCTSTTLTSHRYGHSPRSPIEGNQGQGQWSQPSSASPIWSVAGVSWSQVTVVTLATTI
jgi:hypothetical protein